MYGQTDIKFTLVTFSAQVTHFLFWKLPGRPCVPPSLLYKGHRE